MSKYLVASMNEREKTIAKLKGNLYSLSLDDLVKQAINEADFEVSNMDCLYCKGTKAMIRRRPKTYTENVNGKEASIEVTRYPLNICPSCHAEYDDMDVSLYLQKLVRFEILDALRSKKKMPERMKFEDIIKM